MNAMLDLNTLSVPEAKALHLAQAAVMLDHARTVREDKATLCEALDQNLQLWVAIKTVVGMESCTLSEDLKENLRHLTQYVADTTFRYGLEIPDEVVEALANINLHISEGLLEGRKH
jgi:flagellar biosynthesis regulator FlaF